MLDVGQWPLWLLALGFLGAAAVVWMAGTHLTRAVDAIATRTGIGHAFAGLVLLGGITSLPEVAVSVTASLSGEAVLAVNNVLGSVAAQVALLALADALIGREALTSVVVAPIVLLQAVLNILLLAVVAAAITAGDVAFLGAGAWSWGLFAGYAISMWMLSRYQGRTPWTARPARTATAAPEEEEEPPPLGRLVWRTLVAALLILAAGWLLSRTGSAAAAQTGLGSAFFGATFVAVATSLPEISTMVAAVRLRRYEMALGDIFGTNLFNAALVFLTDLLAPGPPLLSSVGAFSAFGALLGLVLTAIFLAGVVERRDRTVLRMGIDSLAALLVYAGGVALLYALRDRVGG